MTKRIDDARQLHLFGDDLAVDDPVVTFYRRLRKIDATLSLNLEEQQIYIFGTRGIPAWAVKTLARHRDQIRADMLRVEQRIEPAPEPETLAGGATLHRLPVRHPPDLDPPIRPRASGALRRTNPDGAA
jgi:hypothetical protein